MLNEFAFFHRTAKGLSEIQHKTHGLTQSERLVLILIDGVTPCKGLHEKLKGLPEGRFESALHSLLNRGLVKESDVPEADQHAGALDSGVVDRFLRQDPLDPITIAAQTTQIEPSSDEHPVHQSIAEEIVFRPGRVLKVDIYLPLEPLVQPVSISSGPDPELPLPILVPIKGAGRPRSGKMPAGGSKQFLAYWGFLAGMILFMVFIVLQSVS